MRWPHVLGREGARGDRASDWELTARVTLAAAVGAGVLSAVASLPWAPPGDLLVAIYFAAASLIETIVRPLQQGTEATVDEFLDSAGITVVPSIAQSLAAQQRFGPSVRHCGSPTRCRSRPPSQRARRYSRWTRSCGGSPAASSRHPDADLQARCRVAQPAQSNAGSVVWRILVAASESGCRTSSTGLGTMPGLEPLGHDWTSIRPPRSTRDHGFPARAT